MLQLAPFAEFIRMLFKPLTDLLLQYVPLEWVGSLPALTLVVFSILALIIGMRYNPLLISFVGVILATVEMTVIDPTSSFGGLFVRNAFSDFFIYIILIVGFLVLMSSTLWGGERGTYNFLLLVSFAGAIWVVMATDLVALFISWEVMSTPTYVLAALGPNRGAVDGATKYFVMGLLATMLMIFGIALVYGVTGETNLSAVAMVVQSVWVSGPSASPAAYTLMLAMILFVFSFGFKVGIFPGWMWVPDTYSTADGSVTAYLAGATKKAGVSALIRILMVAFIVARLEWGFLIAIVSALTMLIGNVLALAQRNIMRMLAYSSIAMMGYLLMGIAAGTQFGAAAAMFHAFTHALMKSAAFILIWAISIRMAKEITYDDLAGLSQRAPFASAMLGLLITALMAVPFPPTVTFWSKLFLFQSAWDVGLWWLVLFGLMNTVLSWGYYYRVLKYCYMVEPKDTTKLVLARVPMLAVALCVAAIMLLFFNSDVIFQYAFSAATGIIP